MLITHNFLLITLFNIFGKKILLFKHYLYTKHHIITQNFYRIFFIDFSKKLSTNLIKFN